MEIADLICGNFPAEATYFPYRSSSYLTQFFQDAGTGYAHDGSTRQRWVADVLEEILAGSQPGLNIPPEAFSRVMQLLMDSDDATNEGERRIGALSFLNSALRREGFGAFYAPDGNCYLKNVATGSPVTLVPANPHRPFSAEELARREELAAALDVASEDELIEEILLPLFRQLGFQRITAAGHKDKALEYGKDVWMRFTLPTQHVLYFYGSCSS